MNLEAGQVGVVLFGSDRLVKEGETVKRTGEIVSTSIQPLGSFLYLDIESIHVWQFSNTIPRSMSPSVPSFSAVSSMVSVTPLMARVPLAPRRLAVPSLRPPVFCPVSPSASQCRLV